MAAVSRECWNFASQRVSPLHESSNEIKSLSSLPHRSQSYVSDLIPYKDSRQSQQVRAATPPAFLKYFMPKAVPVCFASSAFPPKKNSFKENRYFLFFLSFSSLMWSLDVIFLYIQTSTWIARGGVGSSSINQANKSFRRHTEQHTRNKSTEWWWIEKRVIEKLAFLIYFFRNEWKLRLIEIFLSSSTLPVFVRSYAAPY